MNILKSSLFFLSTILLLASCGGGENNNDIGTLPDADSTSTENSASSTLNNVSKAQLSEALGIYMANQIGRSGLTADQVDMEAFSKNITAVFNGDEPAMDDETAGGIIQKDLAQIQKATQEGNTDGITLDPQFSSALGMMIAKDLKGTWESQFEQDPFIGGFKSTLAQEQSGMTTEQAYQIINQEYAKIQEKLAAEALAKEKPWFEENKKKNSNIQELPSGIQYEILKEGNGPVPTAQNTVKAHYHGTLTNGDVFDSSVERGTPADFPVMGVIKGWQEVLQKMPVGSKWKVYIPSALAYGPQGRPGIPPNSILIFEIELLEIVS